MSLIHCRTDRYICCPFLFAESEVIMFITIDKVTETNTKISKEDHPNA